MHFIFKKEKGFTMIELIISIFILSVAVVGIFSAFSVMVILTSDASNRLTAAYLAQEGMEIVRNIRDTNMDNKATKSWTDGLGPNCDSIGCEADYTTGTSATGAWQMATWTGRPLYTNDTNGLYNYTSGTQTKFERKIIITPIADVDTSTGNIIMVTVQVSWDQKASIFSAGAHAGETGTGGSLSCNKSNCIEVKGTLYDWYK